MAQLPVSGIYARETLTAQAADATASQPEDICTSLIHNAFPTQEEIILAITGIFASYNQRQWVKMSAMDILPKLWLCKRTYLSPC